MSSVLLIAGPPTSGALWNAVAERLSDQAPTRCLELFAAPVEDAGVAGRARHVVQVLASLGPRPVLVAHGLAVPVALHAAAQVPDLRLVLCNGPTTRLDSFSHAIARLPRPVLAALLRPRPALAYLASSAGLRRAVRNPYVMDRDTVVAVCGPLLEDAGQRRAVVTFLRDLPAAVRSTPSFAGPALLCWGDEDRLYPPSTVDEARLLLPLAEHRSIAGGRLMHPVERPWALADEVLSWMART